MQMVMKVRERNFDFLYPFILFFFFPFFEQETFSIYPIIIGYGIEEEM